MIREQSWRRWSLRCAPTSSGKKTRGRRGSRPPLRPLRSSAVAVSKTTSLRFGKRYPRLRGRRRVSIHPLLQVEGNEQLRQRVQVQGAHRRRPRQTAGSVTRASPTRLPSRHHRRRAAHAASAIRSGTFPPHRPKRRLPKPARAPSRLPPSSPQQNVSGFCRSWPRASWAARSVA